MKLVITKEFNSDYISTSESKCRSVRHRYLLCNICKGSCSIIRKPMLMKRPISKKRYFLFYGCKLWINNGNYW